MDSEYILFSTVKEKSTDLKINTIKAFRSISISTSAIQRLAWNPKSRIVLESFGIDPDNFTPVLAVEISLEQWIRLLQFYAKKCRYIPAREILAELKKIIKS
jgi:hypothetical protein